VLLKHQKAPTLQIVWPSCPADNEAVKPEHNNKTLVTTDQPERTKLSG
jgi:hypothetical protein